MPDTDMDAVDTAAAIRRGDFSRREVVEAAIGRANDAGHLGAIVTDAYDRARSAPPVDGPFAGVPTFVKDLAHLGGVRTSWGSRGSGAYVPRKSESFVRRLEATGAVCLGKSATPEFGLTGTTEPLDRDPCRNPWDPSRSVGGSSGGAACLVASGVVPMAHATDGGGSIRIPAACCGLVGLKPSRGLADMDGSNLLPVNIAVNGVLTRTVRDSVAFFDALGIGVELARPPKDPKRLRILLFVDTPTGTPISPDVRDAIRATGRLCASLGHDVEELPCPWSAQLVDDFLSYWGFVAWLQVRAARVLMHHRFDVSRVEPWTTGIAATFPAAPRRAMAAMWRLRGFGRKYAELFDSYDVVVNMVTADVAPSIGHLAPDLPFETAFERVRTWLPVTGFWNTAGAPAMSLPLGKSADGMPIGVQIGAARGNDRLLLQLAGALELAQPWTRVAPRDRWPVPTKGSQPATALGA